MSLTIGSSTLDTNKIYARAITLKSILARKRALDTHIQENNTPMKHVSTKGQHEDTQSNITKHQKAVLR
jgi:hypothetical protein